MSLPNITYLTDVYFGPGVVTELTDVLKSRGVTRPLVVTDRGLTAVNMVDRLPLRDATVFDGVDANPTEANVLAGLQVYREQECDGVVGLGGGSPMDYGKAIALLATHAPPLEPYAIVEEGVERITGDKPPFIAIPTTAGTGSEVGRGALITMNSGRKLAMISRHLVPDAAVCDPQLTVDLPAQLTAATGFDAISHCVETFCSPLFNPVAEAIALDGLTRASLSIRKAVDDGRNLEARGEMMMAALQGGLTFQKGLGLIHSLSHPLGALAGKRLHHGTLNAVFLPHVLRFNLTHCGEKFNRMASALGVTDSASLAGFFETLARDLGLPTSLSDMGVTPSDLIGIAAAAMQDHCHRTNPRPVTRDDCESILGRSV